MPLPRAHLLNSAECSIKVFAGKDILQLGMRYMTLPYAHTEPVNIYMDSAAAATIAGYTTYKRGLYGAGCFVLYFLCLPAQFHSPFAISGIVVDVVDVVVVSPAPLPTYTTTIHSLFSFWFGSVRFGMCVII